MNEVLEGILCGDLENCNYLHTDIITHCSVMACNVNLFSTILSKSTHSEVIQVCYNSCFLIGEKIEIENLFQAKKRIRIRFDGSSI